MRGEVVVEADVAVWAMAEEFSVAVDVTVGHDAVEGDEGALGGVEFRQRERAAVPADAGGEEASSGAAGGVFFDWAGDAPVMGESVGFQVESSKVGDSAPGASLCRKRQSVVNCWIWAWPWLPGGGVECGSQEEQDRGYRKKVASHEFLMHLFSSIRGSWRYTNPGFTGEKWGTRFCGDPSEGWALLCRVRSGLMTCGLIILA